MIELKEHGKRKTFEAMGDEFVLYGTQYENNDSIAIIGITATGETFDVVTVNVEGYSGINDNEVVINHNWSLESKWEKEVIDFIAEETVGLVPVGFSQGLLIKLKEEVVTEIKEFYNG